MESRPANIDFDPSLDQFIHRDQFNNSSIIATDYGFPGRQTDIPTHGIQVYTGLHGYSDITGSYNRPWYNQNKYFQVGTVPTANGTIEGFNYDSSNQINRNGGNGGSDGRKGLTGFDNLFLSMNETAKAFGAGLHNNSGMSEGTLGATMKSAFVGNVSKRACDLKMQSRDLWNEHVLYTNLVIKSCIDTLPDQNAVTLRLIRNQDDIASLVRRNLGSHIADTLSELLKDHVNGVLKLTTEMKKGHQLVVTNASDALRRNGKKIAVLLSNGLKGAISTTELEESMNKHIDFVVNQAVARLNKNYEQEVRSLDRGQKQIRGMSDKIADTIISIYNL